MILIIEIAFILFMVCLLIKALVETVWGILLIVTGLILIASSYIWQFLRKITNLILCGVSPTRRRRIQNLNAARAIGRACLRRRI